MLTEVDKDRMTKIMVQLQKDGNPAWEGVQWLLSRSKVPQHNPARDTAWWYPVSDYSSETAELPKSVFTHLGCAGDDEKFYTAFDEAILDAAQAYMRVRKELYGDC